MYEIELSRKAQKSMATLSRVDSGRVASLVDSLGKNPRQRGVEKIKGASKNRYRARAGNIRIIYDIFDDKVLVLVLAIGQRGDIYKKK